ncbi:MAG: phosphoserine phosphatase RsbU/P [Frankiaceae bacterium]|jgi:sigma-B regulation protein RsbU (phosphoserine phosphatase)|nr:phosphoserine phosphatase RsbU/P [Frankiaceae bacterium]
MTAGDDDTEDLYERAPCGFLSTDPDGLIIRVNDTFLSLTGYRRDELVGRRTFAQLLSVGGRIYHETHYAPMLRMHGSARGIAVEIVRADGDRLPVLVNAVLERAADGSPMVVRAAVFEATDRREYERELLRAKQRAEESDARATAMARTLQQTLIPPTPPHIPGLEVAAAYRPARNGEEVGGDFYDVFAVNEREWVVAVGDVCGKGVEAAVVTALARYTLRTAAVLMSQPSEALALLNDALLRHETERFVTAVLLMLRRDDTSWTVTISCAGHAPPLVSAAGAAPTPLGRPGSLLGVFDDVLIADVPVVLGPGDSLVLYTDGVTEARRGDDFFGEARLRAAIERHAGSATSVTEGVLREVLEFQAGDARDDIAIVTLRVPDVGAPVTTATTAPAPA